MSVINLNELIPIYYANKSELDSYKKICDEQNNQIKTGLAALDKSDYEVGEYKAHISKSTRETIDETKLLQVMKRLGIDEVIKTKEYVDMDALENCLYNDNLPADVICEIDSCISKKEVISLTVKYKKGK